ncbi:MAG: hypothetical protein KF795_25060 [Labilithrix sp.]|nr:hypothetical protein [Labilithrix sp.]
MQQPPSYGHGYGPPPHYQGQPPHGYGPPPGYPPPKRGMSSGMIALIVLGCLFGGCVMCGAIGASGKKSTPAAAAATALPDPSAEAARLAAQQKAIAEAKAAKEKSALETFPDKKSEIAATIKRATTAADGAKWAQADTELTAAETALAYFSGTSVAESKEFRELEARASALRTRVAPQVEKLAVAAAAAAAEQELKASSIAVTSMQLFNDYQANEVAADNAYKGKQLLVTGTVASIDKGPFGGLVLRLATPNEFMSTMCRMERSEQSALAQLQKGERIRVLCKGTGMVLGSPSLDDCTFR